MEYPREETGLSSHEEHGKYQHYSEQDRQTVESFKHQLKASLLLDQVLVIIKAAKGIESKVSHLLAVGTELQDFLSAGLGENGWAWGASCSALAIAIRYVFFDMGYLWH
jgi:hypothetical protein